MLKRIFQGEGVLHETALHLPAHEDREQAQRHQVLLGEPARRLQEASLLLPPRQTKRALPGSGHRSSADDDLQAEDLHQQEQDRRVGSPDPPGHRQGWRARVFEAGRHGRGRQKVVCQNEDRDKGNFC